MLGNRLKEKRAELGLKQDDMARKLNMSTAFYKAIEQNKEMPSVKSLIDIASCLNCSVDFLLSGRQPQQVQATYRPMGKYLKRTPKGWCCTANSCEWRDHNGYCGAGSGCLKEQMKTKKKKSAGIHR